MDKPTRKPTEALVREWTQFILILFAAAWGVYTFVYKEYWAPKAAPINISMTLEARNLGVRDAKARAKEHPLQAIEVKVTARNPSTRNIYLLQSIWFADGIRIAQHERVDDAAMKEGIEASINAADRMAQFERQSSISKAESVAAGSLFEDDALKPGESIARTIVFYVPRGDFDVIDVSTRIPSVAVDGIDLQWKVEDDFSLTPHLFRVESHTPRLFRKSKDSPRTEIELDVDKKEFADKRLEYQEAVSRSSISLWR